MGNFSGAVHTAYRRVQTHAPCPIELAKLAVLIGLDQGESRNALLFGPEQLQRDAVATQFGVHM